MNADEKRSRVIAKIRQGLENFNCPAAFLQDRAESMANHDGKSPAKRVAVVEESVVDPSDIDGRRMLTCYRVAVVDPEGKPLMELDNQTPQRIERFIADYVSEHPRLRWTLSPLCV